MADPVDIAPDPGARKPAYDEMWVQHPTVPGWEINNSDGRIRRKGAPPFADPDWLMRPPGTPPGQQ